MAGGLSRNIRLENLDSVRALMEEVGAGSSKTLGSVLFATAKKMKTRGSKEIRSQLNLSAAYVNERLPIVRVHETVYQIKIPARGRLMSRYPFTIKKGYIAVKIKPKGAASRLPGAFVIPRLRHSNVPGIAYRRPEDKPGPEGGKFDVLHSGSLTQVWSDVMPALAPEFAEFALTEFTRRLNVTLAKRAERG